MFISQYHAQNIVQEMKLAIHKDINIMDQNGIIIASTNPARCGQLHSGASRVLREGLPSLLIQEDSPESGVQAGINLPIVVRGERIGVIGITGNADEVLVFGDVIKRMTEIMIESVTQQEQSDLINNAKGLFIESLLFTEHSDWSKLEFRGRLLGIDITTPYRVVLLNLSNRESPYADNKLDEIRSSRILSAIRTQLAENGKHYCTVIHNRVILLLHESSRENSNVTLDKVCQMIQHYYQMRVSGGVSCVSRSPQNMHRCYLEAQMAETIAQQSGRAQVVFYDQTSFEFVMGSIPQHIRKNLHDMVFSSCTAEEKEEFAQLIRLYIDQKDNISACANQLFVHRNTIQYRMDQLRKKTGYDLRCTKDALLLYLACRENS